MAEGGCVFFLRKGWLTEDKKDTSYKKRHKVKGGRRGRKRIKKREKEEGRGRKRIKKREKEEGRGRFLVVKDVKNANFLAYVENNL